MIGEFRFITENEAAEYLCLSPATLRRWRWAGKGPEFVKIGGAVRYDPVDIDAFIEQGRRRSTGDHELEEARQ